MSLFALVDCNNFYASCERVFNPRLAGRPVVILSNNDGCIVARSNESKALGIPMGAPFFQWRTFCRENNVSVFSSNYELYGDMSGRVMSILETFCPDIEIYSIDEAFLPFEDFEHDLIGGIRALRKTILRWTGIPVSVGIAPTRTLAKVAGYMAKKHTRDRVFDLRDRAQQEQVLSTFPVGEIWGVGRKLGDSLPTYGIITAQALRDADTDFLRQKYGVTMARMQCELRGISCISTDSGRPRQQIISSRSFGRPVMVLDELGEAVSHYTAIACRKLRAQGSVAGGICVFIRTGVSAEKRYEKSITTAFPVPMASTSRVIAEAKRALSRIFKPGYCYKKAGVMLVDISSAQNRQRDLLSEAPEQDGLSEIADCINAKMGRASLIFCAEGVRHGWRNRNDMKSPGYTTRWRDLVRVHCR